MEINPKCPNCGNDLIYHDTLDSYFCMNCNEYFGAETFEPKEENEFTGKYNVLGCRMCGKETIVSVNYKYDVCPFCYNNLYEITEGVRNYKPKYIIPFKDTYDSFSANFFERAKAASVPNEILTSLRIESLKGVYMPFYEFTVENKADCFLITHEISGKNNRDDDYFFQLVSYQDKEDVILDTTRMIDNDTMSRFSNFDFRKIQMFTPERIGEFFALIPQYGGEAANAELKKVVSEKARNEVSKLKRKNEIISELKIFNDLKIQGRKLVLVPVWMMEYTLNENEKHYLFVNGQTGIMASDYEFGPKPTKGWLFKHEVDYQIDIKARDSYVIDEFRSKLEYMNKLKGYEDNKNDRTANIRKIR